MQVEAATDTVHTRVVGLGMPTLRQLIELPGVVVSGHVGRNVSRVVIGDETAYLKREHRVRWRDRFRNWRDGFGPVSVSEREYRVIRRLREHGLPAPQPLARGEVVNRAFLLLAEADQAIELRQFGQIDREIAADLGRTIAQIHNTGIDQPDLFAKHFLVNRETGQITILDWQRATVRGVVSWRRRIRSLAALRATLSDELMPSDAWDYLLAAYLTEYQPASQARDKIKPLLALRAGVNEIASALRRRPGIRSQLVPPIAEQELVRIGGETVCAIPSLARELEHPEVIAALYDPANDGRSFRIRDGRCGVLTVAHRRNPLPRWWAAVRGKSWRSPELRTARLLFHLERYGIPAPRLLAYGQTVNGIVDAGSFVLAAPRNLRPPTAADAAAIRALLARLHEVGCCLRGMGTHGEPFGMEGSTAVVGDVRLLRLNRQLSARKIASDHRLLDVFFGGRR
jgi:tRNA A-37 threonylcarbamoyl transferase component Bud32